MWFSVCRPMIFYRCVHGLVHKFKSLTMHGPTSHGKASIFGKKFQLPYVGMPSYAGNNKEARFRSLCMNCQFISWNDVGSRCGICIQTKEGIFFKNIWLDYRLQSLYLRCIEEHYWLQKQLKENRNRNLHSDWWEWRRNGYLNLYNCKSVESPLRAKATAVQVAAEIASRIANNQSTFLVDNLILARATASRKLLQVPGHWQIRSQLPNYFAATANIQAQVFHIPRELTVQAHNCASTSYRDNYPLSQEMVSSSAQHRWTGDHYPRLANLGNLYVKDCQILSVTCILYEYMASEVPTVVQKKLGITRDSRMHVRYFPIYFDSLIHSLKIFQRYALARATIAQTLAKKAYCQWFIFQKQIPQAPF